MIYELLLAVHYRYKWTTLLREHENKHVNTVRNVRSPDNVLHDTYVFRCVSVKYALVVNVMLKYLLDEGSCIQTSDNVS